MTRRSLAARRQRSPRLETMEDRRLLTTFTVIDTLDDGNAGSLRWAIGQVDGDAGATAATPDTIAFAIPGAGVHTIVASGALPSLTRPAIIDGYTQQQAGSMATPNTLAVGDNAALFIEIDGNNSNADGLTLAAGHSTVRGLVINRWGGSGIAVSSADNVVEGNFLGVDPTGALNRGNALAGVSVESGAGNLIGGTTPGARDVIAGNSIEANTGNVAIFPVSSVPDGTVIEGNYIGTNAAGTAAVAIQGTNPGPGVSIVGSTNTTVGGTSSGARNVIAGNVGSGLLINATSGLTEVTTVQGNYIGVDATGEAALGNLGSGIEYRDVGDATDVSLDVGGTAPGAGNVISGNLVDGIDSNAKRSQIQGNLIGTDALGTEALGNASYGIRLAIGGSDTPALPIDVLVGGTTAASRNIVSGNGFGQGGGDGIRVSGIPTGSVVIQGNLIGTEADGSTALGNHDSGIEADRPVTIGGPTAGAGNVIAFNGKAGVVLPSNFSAPINAVTILGNSIFSNGKLGISLNGSDQGESPAAIGAPTPNSPGGPHSGPNNRQNYPVLTSVSAGVGGTSTVIGTLNSTPNTDGFRVEFFANAAPDPSGFGQGAVFLGSALVNTDGAGNATIDAPVLAVPAGMPFVTATATDPSGNTSEFSSAIAVANAATSDLSPAISPIPDPATVMKNLAYFVTVTNNLDTPATGVTLTDTLPPAAQAGFLSADDGAVPVNGVLTFHLGTLAGHASTRVTIVVLPTVVGTIMDSALVTDDAPNVEQNPLVVSTVVNAAPPPVADLSITGVAPASVTAGVPFAYTLTVANIALPPADGVSADDPGVVVTDTLPAGVEFLSATGGVLPQGGVLTFPLGTLSSPTSGGGPVTLTINVLPTSAGTLTNLASVKGSLDDPNPSNDSTQQTTTVTPAVAAQAALTVGVAGPTGPVTVGSPSMFTVTVSNTGTGAAMGVSVVVPVPPTTAFGSATGGVMPSGGNLTFPVGDLAPGASTTLTISLTPTVAGVVTLAATASSPDATTTTSSATATATAPVLVAPPSLLEIQRYGYHAQPTLLYLPFSTALTPATATAAGNYAVYRVNRRGATVGHAIVPLSATYNESLRSVTLGFAHRLNVHYRYVLQVTGTAPGGVAGPGGLLNGDGTGAGTDYRATFDKSNLAGRASDVPTGSGPGAAAVDALFSSGTFSFRAGTPRH